MWRALGWIGFLLAVGLGCSRASLVIGGPGGRAARVDGGLPSEPDAGRAPIDRGLLPGSADPCEAVVCDGGTACFRGACWPDCLGDGFGLLEESLAPDLRLASVLCLPGQAYDRVDVRGEPALHAVRLEERAGMPTRLSFRVEGPDPYRLNGRSFAIDGGPFLASGVSPVVRLSVGEAPRLQLLSGPPEARSVTRLVLGAPVSVVEEPEPWVATRSLWSGATQEEGAVRLEANPDLNILVPGLLAPRLHCLLVSESLLCGQWVLGAETAEGPVVLILSAERLETLAPGTEVRADDRQRVLALAGDGPRIHRVDASSRRLLLGGPGRPVVAVEIEGGIEGELPRARSRRPVSSVVAGVQPLLSAWVDQERLVADARAAAQPSPLYEIPVDLDGDGSSDALVELAWPDD